MEGLKQGVCEFLSETTIHGFKYLGLRSGIVAKLFWAISIGLCLASAAIMIHNAWEDWEDNPVITSIESIDFPLKEVQFPTLTFCHEQYFKPDNWAILEVIFNFFEFTCGSQDADCFKSTKIRQDFKPLFHKIFGEVSPIVDKIQFNDDLEKDLGLTKKLDNIIVALQENITSFEKLEDTLVSSVGMIGSPSNFALDFIPKSQSNLAKCDDNDCLILKEKVLKFFVKTFLFSMKDVQFGTFLRQMSKSLGITFDSVPVSSSSKRKVETCDLITDIEHLIFNATIDIGKKLGIPNGVLYDVPNFHKITPDKKRDDPLRKYFPLTSYCQAKNKVCQQEEEIKISSGKCLNLPLCTDKSTHKICSNGENVKFTGTNISAIATIMKFAFHMVDETDILNLYDTISSLNLPYKLKPRNESITKSSMTTFLPALYKRHVDADVQLVPSTDGLCYAWNGLDIRKVFKPSQYFKDIGDHFFEDRNFSIRNGAWRRAQFVFDKHDGYLNDREKTEQSFKVGINSKHAFFDMTSTPTLLSKGHKTLITVKPIEVHTHPSLKLALDPERRRCRFRNEVPDNMTLFNEYSMAGCFYECKIDYSARKCGCIPWDTPKPGRCTYYHLCDSAGNACFYDKMQDHGQVEDNCYCLPDCNSVKFSYTEKQLPLKVDKECTRGMAWWLNVNYKRRFQVPNVNWILPLLEKANETGELFDWRNKVKVPKFEDYCKTLHKQDIAVLEIQMEGQAFLRMKQSLRYSDSDKLGVVGGTLGLFCGASVIALAEIFHYFIMSMSYFRKASKSSR